jgi:RNA polymerase sigma-70 factor, ECF subfamily
MNTSQLIERCLAGDQAAIQKLVTGHQHIVFRLSLSILDDPAEADEATQEVMVAALSSLATFRANASLNTWLYRITVNLCRNRLRKRRTKERLIQVIRAVVRLTGESEAHPEEIAIQRESNQSLWQTVDKLGDKHRLPILLHYYHDFSVAEIAQILEIKEGTVLSRLFTARERLRGQLYWELGFNHKAGEENEGD